MANTLVTAIGKAMFADRMRTTPGTYTLPPKYVCHGAYTVGTKTGAVLDQGLLFEKETRVSGTESTVTTTYTGDTYQVQGTIPVNGTYSVVEAMLNDTSGSAPFHTTANGATGASTPIAVNNAGPQAAFRIQIEDEVIDVTSGGTGTSWTVTRGVGGTAAVNHATGSDIGRVIGNMFTTATFAGIGVNSGDSIQYTWKVQLS